MRVLVLLIAVGVLAGVAHAATPDDRHQARALAEDGSRSEWIFHTMVGANHGFPAAADESRERVVRFPRTPSWFKVRVAPARGDVLCFIMHFPNGSGWDGCPHDAQTRAFSRPALVGWHGWLLLFGAVPPATTAAIVRFEDGAQTVLRPRDRLIALEIPKAKRSPGRRPITVQVRTANRTSETIELVWRSWQ